MHRYVIHISGDDSERFLNLCKHGKIALRAIYRDDTGVFAEVTKKDFENIKKFEKKCDCKCSVVMEKGVVPLLKRHRIHITFFACILLIAWFIYYSSLFIWHIDVEGETDYTKEEILSYVSDSLVPLGTRRKDITIADLEKKLRMQYDRLAWITCEVDGTRLVIHLVETITEQNVTKINKPCNIVAIKDGLVTEAIATQGTRMVEPGDEVKKGDILITGAVQIYNEFDELIETNYVPADGEIYAQTRYPYKKELSLRTTQRIYGKCRKYSISISTKNKTTNIYTPSDTKSYARIEDTYTVHLGHSYYLPFRVTIGKYYTPVYKNITYTKQEVYDKQMKILQKYMEDLQKKGVEILENNVTIEYRDGKCLASGTLLVKEKIGAPELLTIPEQMKVHDMEENEE